MIGSTIFDTKNFTARLDKEFKWDKVHKGECGWDDHDITMIAEGMLQATQTLTRMQLEAHQEKKEYKEITHAHWIQKYPNSEHPDIMYCSHCNFYVEDKINNVEYSYKFCPNCSAVMDEEV